MKEFPRHQNQGLLGNLHLDLLGHQRWTRDDDLSAENAEDIADWRRTTLPTQERLALGNGWQAELFPFLTNRSLGGHSPPNQRHVVVILMDMTTQIAQATQLGALREPTQILGVTFREIDPVEGATQLVTSFEGSVRTTDRFHIEQMKTQTNFYQHIEIHSL